MADIPLRAILILLVFACASGVCCAQETFNLPPNAESPPVYYLERMKVQDTSRRLSDREKRELCRLFVRAYVISVRKHGQDYLLKTDTPIYRLLVANFPGVAAREAEGGSSIFLAPITKFFNAQPDYRRDVVQVMRQGISRKNCEPL